MDPQDLRTLKLLEALEKDDSSSQRHLARTLDVSVGLVNAFLKRLAAKGYFKMVTIPAHRVQYMLTAKGMAEKTRLTYEYLQYSLAVYKHATRKFTQLFRQLEVTGEKQIVLFGANDLTEVATIFLKETSLRLVAIVDEQRAGERFLGWRIKPPVWLQTAVFDKIVIADPEAPQGIYSRLLNQGIDKNKIELLN